MATNRLARGWLYEFQAVPDRCCSSHRISERSIAIAESKQPVLLLDIQHFLSCELFIRCLAGGTFPSQPQLCIALIQSTFPILFDLSFRNALRHFAAQAYIEVYGSSLEQNTASGGSGIDRGEEWDINNEESDSSESKGAWDVDTD